MTTILGITGIFALVLGLISWEMFSIRKENKNLHEALKTTKEWSAEKTELLDKYYTRTPMDKLIDALEAMNSKFEIREYGEDQGVLITDRKKPVLFTFDEDGNYKA